MDKKVMLQFDNSKTCHTSFSGRIGLMCPKCYSYVTVESSVDIKASVDSGEDLLVHPVYSLECPDCSVRSSFIEIDLTIAGAVSALNKKGYKTEMCCEVHTDDSNPRAFIKFDGVVTEMFDSLPDGWVAHGQFMECQFNTHDDKRHALESVTRLALDLCEHGNSLFKLYEIPISD